LFGNASGSKTVSECKRMAQNEKKEWFKQCVFRTSCFSARASATMACEKTKSSINVKQRGLSF
jgi:hypothetical protein